MIKKPELVRFAKPMRFAKLVRTANPMRIAKPMRIAVASMVTLCVGLSSSFAQTGGQTIRLNSPIVNGYQRSHNQQNSDRVRLVVTQKTETTTQPDSTAPAPDANTMPLKRLAQSEAFKMLNQTSDHSFGGSFDGLQKQQVQQPTTVADTTGLPASPAVFNSKAQGDPNLGFASRTAFTIQPGDMTPQDGHGVFPIPARGTAGHDGNHQLKSSNRNNFRALRDEYIYDGDDRGKPVSVDENWNIYGMETEDTFGHFDTVDGRRIVQPSNRVAIYAPRFAAVRKVDGVYNARRNTQVGAFEEQLTMNVSRGSDFSSSTKQNVATRNFEGANKASGFKQRTRGITSDQAIELIGVRNSFSPYENLELIKWGRYSGSQMARLELGMAAANVWQDNLRLKAHSKGAQPVIVNDLSRVQQMVHIKGDGKASSLRVTKVASKIAADQGEEVEFTIRFDNTSSKPVGNVTIVDNLTGRLEYVPGSAECSLKAKFIDRVNESNSLMLRWEIIDPVKSHTGGIIRFKCRVR